MSPKIQKKALWILLAVVAIVTLLANQLRSMASKEQETTYDEFLSAVNSSRLEDVGIAEDVIVYRLQEDETVYYTGRIADVEIGTTVTELHENGVRLRAIETEDSSGGFIVSWIVMPLVLYALFYAIMYVAMKKSGGIGTVGKRKFFSVEKETGVSFGDVAGQDEAKEMLEEIIDFLHNPKKYAAIGAKLPKGALLVGSPGTGKTLLAKAVAGEAHVPFFSISGSDFVEMFVGVGASRVRELFREAAKVAPAIIFIDEIDAIGRSRDSRMGGNDEREQTLNQLLAEIDGFDSSKGVVILAATNRPEILDKALLRAGRFDRRIVVDRPNLQGRYQTLLVHTKNIRLSEDVDLRKLAQATAGAVGADLANLVNEAALRAVRLGKEVVGQQELLGAFETVIAGTEKKGSVLTDTEKQIVAYHEVGHALVAALRRHSQPVSKITIVPHTSGALGYTMQMPEEETYLNSKDELLVQLQMLLAGRAAEECVFQTQTSGAANDIQKATELARRMVTQLGMSEQVGLMALSLQRDEYLGGHAQMDCAQQTAAMADDEVRILLKTCYEAAKKLLQENRLLLDKIAERLLQKETITGEELMALIDSEQ